MNKNAVAPKPAQSQPNNRSSNLVSIDPKLIQKINHEMDSFGAHLLVRRGLGGNTICNKKKMAAKALREIGTLKPNHDQVKRYMVVLHGRQHSYWHLTNITRAIENYMDYLGDPIHFGRPKKPKYMPKEPLSEGEISVILSKCQNIRERAVISLLAYTGIRNQELCDLRVRNVDLARNMVHIVKGKGSKGRVSHMAGECSKVLMQYLAEYPRNDDEYLFTTLRDGLQFKPHIPRRMVKNVAGRISDVDRERVHPHRFRHSLASNMLARGAGLMTIKEQLGHADITTTMMYITARDAQIRSEFHMHVPSYL